MKVLIVDNQPHVIQWLTHFLPFLTGLSAVNPVEIRTIEKLSRAVKELGDKQYDVLFLRHDLGQEPKSGSEVRDFLIKNPEVNPGMLIICHGLNEVNDPKNARQLTVAGRLARWFPIAIMPSWQFDGRER